MRYSDRLWCIFCCRDRTKPENTKSTEKDGGIRQKNLQCGKLCLVLVYVKDGKHFVIGAYEAYNVY